MACGVLKEQKNKNKNKQTKTLRLVTKFICARERGSSTGKHVQVILIAREKKKIYRNNVVMFWQLSASDWLDDHLEIGKDSIAWLQWCILRLGYNLFTN
jgi:hypothetical protein